MSIEEIKLLIGLIAEGVALLATIFAFCKKMYDKVKDKKLKTLIEEAMAEVEKTSANGRDKKLMVLDKVVEVFGEGEKIYKKANDYIEECIEFSKKVNSK